LDYTGTGLVKDSAGSASPQGPQANPLSSLLSNALGGAQNPSTGGLIGRVSFSLRGTFEDPKFSPSSIPQFGQGTNQPHPQQPPQPGGNPFNLFPLPLGP
jgi:hypothetical protein